MWQQLVTGCSARSWLSGTEKVCTNITKGAVVTSAKAINEWGTS